MLYFSHVWQCIRAHADQRVELVALLLAAGADPNDADELGNRPLHLVPRCGKACTSGLTGPQTAMLWRQAGLDTTGVRPLITWSNVAPPIRSKSCFRSTQPGDGVLATRYFLCRTVFTSTKLVATKGPIGHRSALCLELADKAFKLILPRNGSVLQGS